MRRGFTLIEMIFVIILLGIVGAISSEIVFNIYRNYATQRAVLDLDMKAKAALEQIQAYLERSIQPSVAVFDNGAGTYNAIREVQRGNEGNLTANVNNALVWIGKDIESLQGTWDGTMNYPAVSGIANLDQSLLVGANRADINITFSDIMQVDALQNAITGLLIEDPIESDNYRSALYFVHADSNGTVEERFWWQPGNSFPYSLLPVQDLSDDVGTVAGQINPADANISLARQPEEFGELFYLTYSAYAVTRGPTIDNQFDLNLTWNFRPWNRETFQANGTSNLLVENITTFEVWSESVGGIIRIRICLSDDYIRNTLGDTQFEYCKETAVTR